MKITQKIMFFSFLVMSFASIAAAQGQSSNLLSSKVKEIIQSRYASNPMMHAYNPSAFKNEMQIVRKIQAVERRIVAVFGDINNKKLVNAMTDIIAVKSIKDGIQYVGSPQYVQDIKLKNLAQEVESQAFAMMPSIFSTLSQGSAFTKYCKQQK